MDDEPVLMECLPDSRVVLEHLETAMGFFVLFVAPVLLFTIIHQIHFIYLVRNIFFYGLSTIIYMHSTIIIRPLKKDKEGEQCEESTYGHRYAERLSVGKTKE